MQCLCAKCHPFEWWLDNSSNFGGILAFYDKDDEGNDRETCACSAFMIEKFCSNSAGKKLVRIQFVTARSLKDNGTKADGWANVPLGEIFSDVSAAVSRLANAGFYLSPETSPESVMVHIREALDHFILRDRKPVECSASEDTQGQESNPKQAATAH
ncbi:hypothetical protein SAMN05444358_1011703 [Ruegeria halocynthiae]|uniref:Uncharacterized protein n=1 Tax=Ruegeria halocynthiae TaxID=985054 RepID=A0A1H2W7N0_9RHOB|nr:hypothetical protein [Ruegeria halocynthiae]SDW76693.1 hypothetical protein SAMN05444358_1011703 [Ruegeria halocynthiae]